MNIVLIGMPGAGKSTIGQRLSKQMSYDFIDTDELIRQRTGKTLQELVEELGKEGFIQKEAQIITNFFVDHFVIATGGSAVYSPQSMAHLKKNAVVVYLKLSYLSMKHRIHNPQTRGIAIDHQNSLYDLYQERAPLYERYADLIVQGDKKTKHQMMLEVQHKIEAYVSRRHPPTHTHQPMQKPTKKQ